MLFPSILKLATAGAVALTLLEIVPATSVGQAPTGRITPLDEPFASRYRISRGTEDALSIDVQVWGQVNRPGQYSVPDRTDLIGLISFAGGPTEDAKLEKILIIRPLATTQRVQEIDIEAFLRSGDPGMIPGMTPGDVVVVPASRSHRMGRWAGWISVAALVANVAVLATRN